MLATRTDAVQEYLMWVGKDKPYTQWILSDYDTWERNPHYVGPDQGHPESGADTACWVFGTFKEASACAKSYSKAFAQTLRVEHYKSICWVVWF